MAFGGGESRLLYCTCFQISVLQNLDDQVFFGPALLYCTVLYCTVLYCTVLYCTVLYCTVLSCTVLYYHVLYCTVLHCTVLYFTELYCTVLYCIAQNNNGAGFTKEHNNETKKNINEKAESFCESTFHKSKKNEDGPM